MSMALPRFRFLPNAAVALSVLLSVGGLPDAQADTFSHQQVIDQARELASQDYLPPSQVAPGLLDLDYDAHRQIRFRKDKALWSKTSSPFEAEFFAPGSYFTSGVELFSVESGTAHAIGVDQDSFDTPAPDIAELLQKGGTLAGYRLHFPINTPNYKDEFVVFLGASYFRAISKGRQYGLSARGLAVDVAEPTGEEFPAFRKFWLERPGRRSNSIVVHALLDSPRVTGAYRFSIYPGSPTYIDVLATLYPRAPLHHVGLGPLTSMFWFGSLDPSDFSDYRPAVHDSEGLAMLSGRGEWIWRPLTNPQSLQISAFSDQTPRGFGLIQRQRKLAAFQDLEAHYHQRPSAWVTPQGDWGAGHVILVEIPSDSEANDNIVAYWRPDQTLAAGEPFPLEYRITWPDDVRQIKNLARVIRSARGLDFHKRHQVLTIDYDSNGGLTADKITPEVSLSSGKLISTVIQDNPETGGWRVVIQFDPTDDNLTEIRLVPRDSNGQSVGETWLHRWLPR